MISHQFIQFSNNNFNKYQYLNNKTSKQYQNLNHTLWRNNNNNKINMIKIKIKLTI